MSDHLVRNNARPTQYVPIWAVRSDYARWRRNLPLDALLHYRGSGNLSHVNVSRRKSPMITVLAVGNNGRGDVFTRLMSDVFHSLGYDELRFNVQQAGREVDILGRHCIERRMIAAECKTQNTPIGGSDLKKFYGVLDAERRKTDVHIEGYFVSTSGFTETAIQQEKDLGGRFALLGEKEIIFHLIRGRIIVTKEDASSEAVKWPGSRIAGKNKRDRPTGDMTAAGIGL